MSLSRRLCPFLSVRYRFDKVTTDGGDMKKTCYLQHWITQDTGRHLISTEPTGLGKFMERFCKYLNSKDRHSFSPQEPFSLFSLLVNLFVRSVTAPHLVVSAIAC